MKTTRRPSRPLRQLSRNGDAVRHDVVVARTGLRHVVARLVGDGDPHREPAERPAAERAEDAVPLRPARDHVEGADERRGPAHERGQAGRGQHRLVQVHDVVVTAPEQRERAGDGARPERDALHRAVVVDRDAAPERDHPARRGVCRRQHVHLVPEPAQSRRESRDVRLDAAGTTPRVRAHLCDPHQRDVSTPGICRVAPQGNIQPSSGRALSASSPARPACSTSRRNCFTVGTKASAGTIGSQKLNNR